MITEGRSAKKVEEILTGDSISFYLTRKFPITEEGGNVLLGGISIDITERKRAEEALRESEQRFRTVADFTHNSEYWIDPDNNLIYQSPSVERITGYTAEEFIENHPGLFTSLVYPEDKEQFSKHFENDLNSSEVTRFAFRIISRSGEVRWLENITQPVYDSEGNFSGRRGSSRDITERKQAEEALRESEARWRLLLQSIPAFVAEIDLDGVIVSLNRTQPGFSLEDFLGKSVFDIAPPSARDTLKSAFAEVIEKEISVQYKYETPDFGPNRIPAWYHDQLAPIMMNGEITSVILIVTDITERKLAEEKLRESEQSLGNAQRVAKVGSYEFDLKTNTITYSDEMCNILGLDKESYIHYYRLSTNYLNINENQYLRY